MKVYKLILRHVIPWDSDYEYTMGIYTVEEYAFEQMLRFVESEKVAGREWKEHEHALAFDFDYDTIQIRPYEMNAPWEQGGYKP